jgi:hypothetical protein
LITASIIQIALGAAIINLKGGRVTIARGQRMPDKQDSAIGCGRIFGKSKAVGVGWYCRKQNQNQT